MITPLKASPSWLLAVLLGLTTACSTPGPPRDPVEDAFIESQEALLSGIDEGFEESESVDEYVVTTRHNPCRCEAPKYEIYIHGRWTRVFLEADDAVMAKIRERFARDQSALTTVELRGSLSGDETTSRGIEFAVFEVSRVDL